MQLIPPVPVMIARLDAVEAQLVECDSKLKSARGLDRQRLEIARATLERRKLWYVRRIRTAKPATVLGISVAETVSTADAVI